MTRPKKPCGSEWFHRAVFYLAVNDTRTSAADRWLLTLVSTKDTGGKTGIALYNSYPLISWEERLRWNSEQGANQIIRHQLDKLPHLICEGFATGHDQFHHRAQNTRNTS